jgi:hypothetical protein
MKVSVTFKTPDAVADALDRELNIKGLNDYEAEELLEQYQEKFEKWVKYGEYVTIDFDLDAGTASVQESK